MINFVDFLTKRNIPIKGVLHVGSHTAEEEPDYLKLTEKKKIFWVEANYKLYKDLTSDPERNVTWALITDKDGEERDFILTNNNQSSSVLELNEHKKLFPWVHETGRTRMKTSTIDKLFYDTIKNKGINMLTMDIQGAELMALQGADKTLHHIDVIYTEINLAKLYTDCPLVQDLDSFLEQYGFYRAETLILDQAWGDAIYLRKDVNKSLREGEDLDRVWNMFKPLTKTMIDVGARCSEYPDISDRQYHLFDPNEKHYNDLRERFENYPNVYNSKLALGNERKTVTYYPDSESINKRFFTKTSCLTVYQDTLDNYCDKMGINRIDFLKIDTEGHELDVLQGGKNILSSTEAILFEYGGTYPDAGITLRDVYNLLFEKGFVYIYLIGKKGLLYQPEPIEHCQYSNYLALRTTWKEATKPNPKISITCINLDRSVERRTHSKRCLEKVGLPFDILSAVDGGKIDLIGKTIHYRGERFVYNPISKGVAEYKNGTYPIAPKELTYGEIGCFLSHIKAYQKALQTDNDYFLVLEDDNDILDCNLARRQLRSIPEKEAFEMAYMSASMNRVHFSSRQINDYYGTVNDDNFNRANAILFTRKGLEKVLSVFIKVGVCMPLDDFIEYCRLTKITALEKQYACRDISRDILSVYPSLDHNKTTFRGRLYFQPSIFSRLGNRLFQYAFLLAQSIEKNMDIVFTRKCQELEPFSRVKYYIGDDPTVTETVIEKGFEYEPEIDQRIVPHRDYRIEGYFQTCKYFSKYSSLIKDFFQLDNKIKSVAKREYVKLSGGRRICGVHIRLPDCKGESGFIYTTPSKSKLFQAVEKVLEKDSQTRFVIASNDLELCREKYTEYFPSDTIFLTLGKYEDFAFLTLCDDLIITSGSYSWWSAYLNTSVNKTVYALTPNFNQEVERVASNKENDYYLDEWIKI